MSDLQHRVSVVEDDCDGPGTICLECVLTLLRKEKARSYKDGIVAAADDFQALVRKHEDDAGWIYDGLNYWAGGIVKRILTTPIPDGPEDT